MEAYLNRHTRKEEIKVSKTAKKPAVIRIDGDLDGEKACWIKDEVERLKHRGERKIVVNFRDVNSFTLFGIGMLRSFLSDLETEGEEIWIGGLQEKFRLLFRRFGYARV